MVWLQTVLVSAFACFTFLMALAAWRMDRTATQSGRLFAPRSPDETVA